MVEHHIQRQILRLLGTKEKARFTDIRPDELENNAFQYHLKQLISAGLVVKNPDGTYDLTAKGTGEYITSHLTQVELATQAHAIFLLAVQRGEEWLLATRKVKPQKGLTGFLHGEPSWDEDLQTSAQKRLLDRTGLAANFEVRGAGYIRQLENDTYSSFVHATLLYAKDPEGTLSPTHSYNDIAWHGPAEIASLELIPSMEYLWKVLEGSEPPFFDLTY